MTTNKRIVYVGKKFNIIIILYITLGPGPDFSGVSENRTGASAVKWKEQARSQPQNSKRAPVTSEGHI